MCSLFRKFIAISTAAVLLAMPPTAHAVAERFTDAGKVLGWAHQAMAWATTHGIIKGDGGRLNPQGTATRAQVAQIFYNCRNFLAKTAILAPQATWVVDVPGKIEYKLVPVTEQVWVEETGHWE